MTAASDWLLPRWPVPPGVGALCTTRSGGVSEPPYDSLNLGDHVGDAADRVAANRACLAGAMPARPVFLRQVHGVDVAALAPDSPDGAQADGCVTTERGVACTIMVADCLPILLADVDGRAVAAAHAGWRGLAGSAGDGIVEHVFDAFRAVQRMDARSAATKTIAWLGPCIGPDAFEVGDEVRQAFEASDPAAAACFRRKGPDKWLADLPALARLRLRALGIDPIFGNDGSAPWCTVGNASRFFSHRRDRVSGRMAACVWLR